MHRSSESIGAIAAAGEGAPALGGFGGGGGGYRWNWDTPIVVSPHDGNTLFAGAQVLREHPLLQRGERVRERARARARRWSP